MFIMLFNSSLHFVGNEFQTFWQFLLLKSSSWTPLVFRRLHLADDRKSFGVLFEPTLVSHLFHALKQNIGSHSNIQLNWLTYSHRWVSHDCIWSSPHGKSQYQDARWLMYKLYASFHCRFKYNIVFQDALDDTLAVWSNLDRKKVKPWPQD